MALHPYHTAIRPHLSTYTHTHSNPKHPRLNATFLFPPKPTRARRVMDPPLSFFRSCPIFLIFKLLRMRKPQLPRYCCCPKPKQQTVREIDTSLARPIETNARTWRCFFQRHDDGLLRNTFVLIMAHWSRLSSLRLTLPHDMHIHEQRSQAGYAGLAAGLNRYCASSLSCILPVTLPLTIYHYIP